MAAVSSYARQRKHKDAVSDAVNDVDQSDSSSGSNLPSALSSSNPSQFSSPYTSPRKSSDSADPSRPLLAFEVSADLSHPSTGKARKTSESNRLLGSHVPKLLSYDEIPQWYQDNDYIRHGYRPESRSAKACFASWLYLHNETVNIYTHLVPAMIFLMAEIWVFASFKNIYPQAKPLEPFIFAFFLFAAFLCLGTSATYHTLINHSENVSHLWLHCDFVGIVILTLGDFVSGIYMGFYCEPTLQKVYWTMIVTLGTGTTILLVNPRFQGKKYRSFRVGAFVCTGCSGFVPIIHGWVNFGISPMMKQSGLPYYLVEGLLLISGALFYTTRMPEATKPGRFDYFGCSHQIFHVLVVMATIVQLVGIMKAYDYNYYHRTCGPAYAP